MAKGLVILTGGPGTGKTSILKELKKDGFSCLAEMARKVIADNNEKDITNWVKTHEFNVLVFNKMFARHNQVNNHLAITDRSLIDTVAYMNLFDLEVPQLMLERIGRVNYHKRVFIAPLWDEIYANDKERLENKEEALRIENSIKATYKEFGFELLEIPKLSVKERTNWIKSEIR